MAKTLLNIRALERSAERRLNVNRLIRYYFYFLMIDMKSGFLYEIKRNFRIQKKSLLGALTVELDNSLGDRATF